MKPLEELVFYMLRLGVVVAVAALGVVVAAAVAVASDDHLLTKLSR